MKDLETVLKAYENHGSKDINPFSMDCDKCPYQYEEYCSYVMYEDMYEHLKALKEENRKLLNEINKMEVYR